LKVLARTLLVLVFVFEEPFVLLPFEDDDLLLFAVPSDVPLFFFLPCWRLSVFTVRIAGLCVGALTVLLADAKLLFFFFKLVLVLIMQ